MHFLDVFLKNSRERRGTKHLHISRRNVTLLLSDILFEHLLVNYLDSFCSNCAIWTFVSLGEIKNKKTWCTVNFFEAKGVTCMLYTPLYLQQLHSFGVLFLSTQLSHLDENWLWVSGVLGLQICQQLSALISLTNCTTVTITVRYYHRKNDFSFRVCI